MKTTFDAISNPFQGPGQAVSGLPKWRRNRKKEVTVNFLLLERIVPVPLLPLKEQILSVITTLKKFNLIFPPKEFHNKGYFTDLTKVAVVNYCDSFYEEIIL